MALPRAKVKPAIPALVVAGAPERRATRAELARIAAIFKGRSDIITRRPSGKEVRFSMGRKSSRVEGRDLEL